MLLTRRRALGLLASALAIPYVARPDRAAAEVIVPVDPPYRLGVGQPGGQSLPALTPNGWNGAIATWLNHRSATDRRGFVRYYNQWGDPREEIALTSATGPTAGRSVSSVVPISFEDQSALILFAADARTGAAKGDIFAQRVNYDAQKVGQPIRVNQIVANEQTRVLATRLTNGNVFAVWLTVGSLPSTVNIRGRVIRKNGTAVSPERYVTLATTGAQAPTALAPLAGGNSVLAYTVTSGSGASEKNNVLVQRLNSTGVRIGNPTLLKSTTGPNTYGGAGVAALPGGRFMALWFVAGSGGTAVLKRCVFQANGARGPVANIGNPITIRPTSPNGPKAVGTPDGVMFVNDASGGGQHGLIVSLLNPQHVLIASKVITTDSVPLVSSALLYVPGLDLYYLAFTRHAPTPSGKRAFAQIFYPSAGCSVKC